MPIDSPEARDLIARRINGTTSKPSDYTCLWLGEHLALLRWKGSSRRGWSPASLRLVDKAGGGGINRTTSSLDKHYGDITRASPLTKARLSSEIAAAKVADASWLDTVAAKRAAKRAANKEREAGYALDKLRRDAHQDLLDAAYGGDPTAILAAAAAYKISRGD